MTRAVENGEPDRHRRRRGAPDLGDRLRGDAHRGSERPIGVITDRDIVVRVVGETGTTRSRSAR
jgi:hypothetical protein